MESQENCELDAAEAYTLIKNLQSLKSSERDASIRRLPELSKLLGTDRTIIELIPYIVNSSVLPLDSLASAIRYFSEFPLDGFTEAHLLAFFETSGQLVDIDSDAVRQELMRFFDYIFSLLDKEVVTKFVKENILEYYQNDWPTVVLTGIYITNAAFTHLTNSGQKMVLNAFFSSFSDPKSPIIQRYIADACEGFIFASDDDRIFEFVLKLTKIDSPTIAYDIPHFIGTYLEKEESNLSKVEPIMIGLLKSPNWRIRCNFFLNLEEIDSISQLPLDLLLDLFHLGLKDEDEEVRIAVAQCILLLPPNNDESITIIKTLLSDPSPHVRTASIDSISRDSDGKLLNEYLSIMLDDKVREVRAAALDSLNEADISEHDITSLLISFLDKPHEWREKEMVANIFINKDLSSVKLLKKLIFDEASIVRNSIILKLPYLTQIGEAELIPIINEASKHYDYQIRQAAVFIIIVMAFFQGKGLEILERLAHDEVSNVRLSVAIYTPRSLSIVSQLAGDEDEDVRDFAIDKCLEINQIVNKFN